VHNGWRESIQPAEEFQGSMSTQSVTTNPVIVWDDSVVIVFSFTGVDGATWYGGFVHQIFSIQMTSGTQTQVSTILQSIQQTAIQQALDPSTWVETIKAGSRGAGATPPVTTTIVYDDVINVPYTTQTNQSFQLALLYAIYG
jgi:hypothetical protein